MTELSPDPDDSADYADPRKKKRWLIAVGGVLALLAALYGSSEGLGNLGGKALASAADLKSLAKGPIAAFLPAATLGEPLSLTFVDRTGKKRALSEWKGKVVLLNVWATWCAPCRKEMPALDQLKSDLGGPAFDVLAISTDRGGPDKAAAFFDENKVTKLEVLNDNKAAFAQALRVIGMPTTLLIDKEGREIGRLIGPAEWASPEGKALIGAAIAAGS